MLWMLPLKFLARCKGAAVGLIFSLFVMSALVSQLRAQKAAQIDVQPGQAAILSLGGTLYDNHWLIVGRQPPSGRHPLFPTSVEISDAATWRCVSCHGWDYRGAEGHMGKTSTNHVMKSLAGVVGQDPQQIVKRLSSKPHRQIVAPIPPDLLLALAKFLSYGQHEMSHIIGSQGKAIGDPMRGKDIFEGVCRRCHDADGKAPIYGEEGDIPSLGWLIRNRPEQTVHKIRNGVPLADMLSLRFLDLENLSDLLAYLQVLDPE